MTIVWNSFGRKKAIFVIVGKSIEALGGEKSYLLEVKG